MNIFCFQFSKKIEGTNNKLVGFRRMFFFRLFTNVMQFTCNHSYTCRTVPSIFIFIIIVVLFSVLFVSEGSQVTRGAKHLRIYSLFMGQCLNVGAIHNEYVDESRVKMRKENCTHLVRARKHCKWLYVSLSSQFSNYSVYVSMLRSNEDQCTRSTIQFQSFSQFINELMELFN